MTSRVRAGDRHAVASSCGSQLYFVFYILIIVSVLSTHADDDSLKKLHQKVVTTWNRIHPIERQRQIEVQHHIHCAAIGLTDAIAYYTKGYPWEESRSPVFVTSPCMGTDSLGNNLGNYFNAIACANQVGMHYLTAVKVWDPPYNHTGSYFLNRLPYIIEHKKPIDVSNISTVNSLFTQYCSNCHGGSCHENPNAPYTRDIKNIKIILNDALAHHIVESKKTKNMDVYSNTIVEVTDLSTEDPGTKLPFIPDVSIHYRCGDNFVGHYGFVPFSAFPKMIPKNVKSIYILAEKRSRKTINTPPGVPNKRHLARTCDLIFDSLFKYLKNEFPNAIIVIRRGDDIYADMARLAYSKLTICSVSTFCLWPAIMSNGTVYYPKTKLIGRGNTDTLSFGFTWFDQPQVVLGQHYFNSDPGRLIEALGGTSRNIINATPQRLLQSISADKNLCPISSILDPAENSRYSYPISIFDSTLLPQVAPNDSWRCYSGGHLQKERHYHTCASKIKTCPVHAQNLVDAVSRSAEWVPSDFMCGISLKNNSKPINIVLSGGSVVFGIGTHGHACFSSLGREDEKCKANSSLGLTNFGKYLEFYFKNNNMNHVNVYNLAGCGISSGTMPDKLMMKMDKAGLIPKLSSSDLVIIDHSTNDVSDADHQGHEDKIRTEENKKGLEILIRKFLSMGCPNIVVLETHPYASEYIRDNVDFGYKVIYTPVAKHYKLPIWSISDATSSKYVDLHQHEYLKYLRNDKSVRINHFAWFIHLYYADIILTLLTDTLNKCPGHTTQRKDIIVPAPLANNLAVDSCDDKYSPVLHIPAVDVYNHRRVGVVGNWSASSRNTWEVKSENRDRLGWIQENNSDYINPKLTFSVPSSYAEVKVPSKKLLLKIEYLKTYLNAGQVQVYICGDKVGTNNNNPGIIDALWDSYDSFKYSLPVYMNYDLDSTSCAKSSNITVSIEYLNHVVCSDSRTCANETIARTPQRKFKVISAKICVSM